MPKPTARQWLGISLLGATGVFLYNAFFFSALAELSASRAALIIATNPALTAVATWLVFRQRFAWWQWVGVATAFAGVAIVVSRGNIALVSDAFGLGELLMFGGAVSWVVYTLVGRSLMQRQDALSPLATTAYASGVGLLLLASAAIFELPQVQWTRIGLRELVAVGYLGLLGTAVGFVWFYEGVKDARCCARVGVHEPRAGIRRGTGGSAARRAATCIDDRRWRRDAGRRQPDQCSNKKDLRRET